MAVFLVQHLGKVVSYPSVPMQSLGDKRLGLVLGGLFICVANVQPFRLVISGERGAGSKPESGVFLFHTHPKVGEVTVICLFSCALAVGLRS